MNKNSIKKMAFFSLNTFVALGVLSTTIISFSNPSQAQTSRCSRTFLRDTIRSQTNFTNGPNSITLVRSRRVQGNPSFDVYFNRRFVRNFANRTILIPEKFALDYQLGPDLSGQVVQKPVAISCFPWRKV
jgi:hypothetical protein